MLDLSGMGKLLMIGGVLLVAVGAFMVLADKIPFLGKLPGDIYIQRKQFSFYFPVVTCVVLSLLITVLLNLFSRR